MGTRALSGLAAASQPAEAWPPAMRLRSWWRRLQGRRQERRARRRLSGLGSVPAHCQSRYGLLKSRELL